MGNVESIQAPPPMQIHHLHGKFLRISENRLAAERVEGYADAMFFGSRTVARDEKIELVITKLGKDWNGSLRFGFTSHNPIAICNHPEGIPRYMCPDLVKRGGSFIENLNHIKLLVKDTTLFWVTQGGEVKFNVNGVMQRSQLTKLVTTPVWPVVDVYGNTVAVTFRSLSDDPDLLEKLNEPRFYSSLNLNEFPFVGNPDSIEITNRNCCERVNLQRAFVWNSRPLAVNHLWVLFLNKLDQTHAINLSFGVSTTPVDNITDSLQRFTNRPKVFEDIYVRNVVGDELAICITNNGDVMVALNGDNFRNIGKVPKNEFYWLIADLNCCVKSMISMGCFPLTEDALPHLPNVKGSNLPRERNLQVERELVPETNMRTVFETNAPSIPVVETVEPEPPVTENKCLECRAVAPNTVFIECGDICCCEVCAAKLFNSTKKCPKCKVKFTKSVKVFF